MKIWVMVVFLCDYCWEIAGNSSINPNKTAYQISVPCKGQKPSVIAHAQLKLIDEINNEIYLVMMKPREYLILTYFSFNS